MRRRFFGNQRDRGAYGNNNSRDGRGFAPEGPANPHVDPTRLAIEADLEQLFGPSATRHFGSGGGGGYGSLGDAGMSQDLNQSQSSQLGHDRAAPITTVTSGSSGGGGGAGKKRTRVACMQEPLKRHLYQLVVRQLAFDGYLHAAEAVATSTGVITPHLFSDGSRLAKLVKYGMAAEEVRQRDKRHFLMRNNVEAALSDAALYVPPVDGASTSVLTMTERFASAPLGGIVRSCCFNGDGTLLAAAGTGSVGVRVFSVTEIDDAAARHQTSSAVVSTDPLGIGAGGGGGARGHNNRNNDSSNDRRKNGADGSTAAAFAATTAAEIRHVEVTGTASIEMVRFHPRKAHVIFGTREGCLYVTDISAPQEVQVLTSGCIVDSSPIRSATFLQGGNQLVYCTDEKALRILDIPTQQLFTTPVHAHTAAITDVDASSDGRRMVSSSNDGTAALYDVVSGRIVTRLDKAHSGVPVTSTQLSRSGDVLLTNGMDSIVRLFDLRKASAEVANFGTAFRAKHRLRARFVHSERAIVAQTAAKEQLTMYDIYSGDVQATLATPSHEQHGFAASPEELTVISGAADRCLHMWGVALREQ